MPISKNLPSGVILFLDANIFLEHLINANPSCTTLFQRLQARDIRGITSVVVLAEVRHRLLLTEAVRQGHIKNVRRALIRLRENPRILERLGSCDTLLTELVRGAFIRIVGVTPVQLRNAQKLSLKHRLLTNDALHLATMRAHRIRVLATADRDFRRVPRLNIWQP